MATERVPEFGRVSRRKGAIFESLALGSSLLGILTLAVLVAFVTVDAFGLDAADDAWFVVAVATVVVPALALSTYGAWDTAVVRRGALALVAGVPVAAAIEAGLDALGSGLPILGWGELYVFAVVVPVAGRLLVVGRTEVVGGAASALFGRAIGGTALALGILVLFEVVAPQLWALAFTLAVLPVLALGVYADRSDSPWPARLRWPTGVLGLVAAVGVHTQVVFLAPYWAFYVWSIAVPVAAGVGVLAEGDRRRRLLLSVATLLALVLGSLAIGTQGIAAGYGLLVLVGLVPAGRYAIGIATRHPDRLALLVPAALVFGTLAAWIVASVAGIVGPDPWIDAGFLTNPSSRTASDAGFYPAIVGSVLLISLVAAISFGFGVGTAVFLEEYTSDEGLVGALSRLLQINIANLAAVPSVVYGLLGLALFANFLGFGLGTILTASLTLSLLILPITIIAAQEALRSVPDDLRRGSDAMGATRWQTTRNVVLPEAMPGILTGTILALGRAIGETAPLLLIGAVGTQTIAPRDIGDKISAMPLQLYNWYPLTGEFPRGVVPAGVVTLLAVLLVMNGAAIVLRNRYERSGS